MGWEGAVIGSIDGNRRKHQYALPGEGCLNSEIDSFTMPHKSRDNHDLKCICLKTSLFVRISKTYIPPNAKRLHSMGIMRHIRT